MVIIGGSYAGLSAGLALGRAIRNVLILDSGRPCNRHMPHSHNFLTQDGSTPAAIAAQAKEQVLAYPTVQFRADAATRVEGKDDSFTVTTAGGLVVRSRKLLFATGVRDLLPAVRGFTECWGISVIHCPYCHGYEYRSQATGILLNGTMAFEQARLLRNWTRELTIFTNGESTLDAEQRQQLADWQVSVVETPVQELAHRNGYLTHVALSDGQQLPLTALYARPPFEQHCPLPQALGCLHTEAGYLQVDETQQTSQPGIYAAGDATTPRRAVTIAVTAGTLAGIGINHDLLASL
ncbi:NAD(P)/FAD-dependent oxidoreductase [Hymenobacter translucens]|uniref:NAD(P)/FAD-dependent oxidoreductase n=1 Tax=Hymenobacter translucens TaxID=2886507 RepID=UPI00293F0EFD|nr:NAD(P)/FAD-dependent oxidoreductase [Hymenobacter translucens]